MPAFLIVLAGVLVELCKPLVGRVLLALGIGFVTYAGISTGISAVENTLKTGLQGLPSGVVGFLAGMWIDKALSMVFAAITARLVINGLTSGSITKMVTKTPT